MTNPRALNLSDDFSSQIPQIQQMVQDNKILTGELIRPPQQITAFRVGGANAGGASATTVVNVHQRGCIPDQRSQRHGSFHHCQWVGSRKHGCQRPHNSPQATPLASHGYGNFGPELS